MANDCGDEVGKHKQNVKNEENEEKVVSQGKQDILKNIDLKRKVFKASTLSCAEETNQVRESESALPKATGSSNSLPLTGSIKNSTTAQSIFSQKLAILNMQTKNLRDVLGIRQQELKQQAAAVLQSSGISKKNDDLAKKAMSILYETTSGVKHLQNESEALQMPNDVKSRPSSTRQNESVDLQLPNDVTSRPRSWSHRELKQQVEGLQELLNQLILKNPQLKDSVQKLVKSNPNLQNLNLFTSINTDTSNGANTRFFGSNARTSRTHKQRRESEMSSASTISQKDATENVCDNITGDNKSRKKRSQRKRKLPKPHKNMDSELETFKKYVNQIVGEYLGEEQKEKLQELEFKGTFDDLEMHAQKLVKAGIGGIVEDEIRINRKNSRQSFITISADREGTERDGIITLPVARRYAFDGDIVRAFVMNRAAASTQLSAGKENNVSNKREEEKTENDKPTITGGKDNSFCLADENEKLDDMESPDSEVDATELDVGVIALSDNCPKSFVIKIVKQTELREVVGAISFTNSTKLNDEVEYYKLKPYDMRIPMVYIPVEVCSVHIATENKADICGMLCLARILETDLNGHCIGELMQPVGKVGNLEAEMKAILLHNGFKDIKPFEQRFNDLYAQSVAPITATDLHGRENWRDKCIFTIDPLTARDLDDAVSVERLADDLFEVGVHISDVSYYLQEDSELDNIVKKRATSIYLVNEVIHMLPQTLCFKCSLLPGENKFAFSVFWHMNSNGNIIGEPRFTRTIINSCVQLAYEHAQKVIDNPNENFNIDDFPTICNGFTVEDICSRVKILNKIAEQMRTKRFDNGAMAINNPKLRFNLDPITGEALSYEVDGRQEANFLIEEFMLLANQSVARFIRDRFPNISILRNHPPPLSKTMKNLREKLSKLGMELDCNSSKTLYASMQKLCRESNDPEAMNACLSTLLTKSMARAKYFCSEGKSEEADLWHYALSIPIYTHFTSPIRRYPDILVHRVLAAALNYCSAPKRSTDELHMLAKICNDQKYNAKNAGDESINLFFKRYVKEKKSITLRAVVTDIFQHLLNVVTIETGHSISINYKMQKVLVNTSNAPSYILIAERNSKNPPLKLQLFSTVDVKLVIWDDKLCGFFVSPNRKQRQINNIEMSKTKQQQQQTGNSSANNSISESSVSCEQRHT